MLFPCAPKLEINFSDKYIQWHLEVLALENKAKCARCQRVSIKRVTRAWSLCRERQVCPGSVQLWPGLSISPFLFYKGLLSSTMRYLFSGHERSWLTAALGKVWDKKKGLTWSVVAPVTAHHIRFQTYWVLWNESVFHKASTADTAEHSYISLLLLSSDFPKSFLGVETSFSLIRF